MNTNSSKNQPWNPLAPDKINSIRQIFSDLYPDAEHGEMAERIS
jgi:hypothetical protein